MTLAETSGIINFLLIGRSMGDQVQKEVSTWIQTWEMLPGELQAYILLVFGVMGITWILRETAFYHLPKRKRSNRVVTSAFSVGVLGGLVTWYINNSVGIGAGLILSATSGMSAVAIHHILVNKIIPLFRKEQPRRRKTDL